MLYEFKLGHNAADAAKNICCGKGKEIANHSTVTRWSTKFHSGSKNLDDQARSGRLKTIIPCSCSKP